MRVHARHLRRPVPARLLRRATKRGSGAAHTPAVVVPPVDHVNTPAAPARPGDRTSTPGVYIAADVLDMLSADDAVERPASERHDLDRVVHAVLAVGLAVSAALMLAGVALGLALHRQLPEAMPALGAIPERVLALRPSGFLALGLLVLIVTPILRVIGSVAAFVYERDWRFAAVTGLVLLVLLASLLLGKGG